MKNHTPDNQAKQAAVSAFGEGWQLAQTGRIDEAAARFRHAAQLASADIPLTLEFCSRLVSINYDYEAIEILQQATEREPRSRELWIALAGALAKVWQLKAAIPAYERALDAGSPTAKDLVAYANTLFLARKPEAARRILQRARELGANDPGTLYLQARCEGAIGNRDRERELAQQAIKVKRDFGSAWELLLDTTPDEELQDFAEECLQLADEKTIASNNKAIVLYAAGRALDKVNDIDQAFAAFERANLAQKADAFGRGLNYDRGEVEQFIEQIQTDFNQLATSATASQSDAQPIFIVGMVRSGTSVIEQILGGLDGVVMGGESDALEVVAGKYYWAVNHGRANDIGELASSDWDAMAQEYWQLQTVSESRVTDKAPLNFRHVGLACAMFPNSPIVYVRRDPRDVGLSIYSRYFSDAHYYATDLANIAHFIEASERLMSYWLSRFPERIFKLQFEEFLANPQSVSQQLADFCGLEWNPSCLDFHEREDATYTFSEAQVREPLNMKGVARWERYAHHLTPLLEALPRCYSAPQAITGGDHK
jgi:tetratricopeptide (TPR) repeat protein